MKFSARGLFRFFGHWFLINSVAACFLIMVQLPVLGRDEPDFNTTAFVLESFLSFQFVSFACAIAAAYVTPFFQDRGFIGSFARVLPMILAAAWTAVLVLVLLSFIPPGRAFDPATVLARTLDSIPYTSVICVVMTAIFTRLEHLEYRNKLLERRSAAGDGSATGEPAPGAKAASEHAGLTLKEGENHYIVPYRDIVYVSAHGKAAVVHARTRDYRSARLLKEIEAQLPADRFMRIHKSFIVRLGVISHIQYFMGGSYLAFLNDEDETNLPVSKKYAPALKRILGV